EEDKSRLTAAGFDTYLAKPLEPAAVVRLVRDLSRAS
ncbi:MAG: response regulator, partial [Acidobacteria bacterium]